MRFFLRLTLLLAAFAGFGATVAAQTPSPRACDAARRSGRVLTGCPSPRPPRPSPSRPPRPQPPESPFSPPTLGMLEQPLPFYLARADAARGERAFARCAACHTIEEGGTGSVGPNLWGVSGNRLAASSSYAYSDALRNRGGNWDWAMLNAWLTLPRAFAPGTRMTFAGVSGAQERADLLLFLNEHGGTLSLPDPAEGAAR